MTVLPSFTIMQAQAERDVILAAYRNDPLALIDAVKSAMDKVPTLIDDESGKEIIDDASCEIGCVLLGCANLLALHTLCTLNEIDPDEGLVSEAAGYLMHAVQHGSETAMLLAMAPNATEAAKSLYTSLERLGNVYDVLAEIETLDVSADPDGDITEYDPENPPTE